MSSETDMGEDIRVLIAEDSLTVRLYLKNLIDETPGMRVIGTAGDGEEAIRLAQELRPDVISMDISMPRVDGLEAIRRIMAACPTPVVVVSGLLEVDIELSLQALQAGALAVVSKPPDRNNPEFPLRRQQLVTTLKAMAGVRVISRRDKLTSDESQPFKPTPKAPAARPIGGRRVKPEILVIGASTGGPSALHRLLQSFNGDFPVPVVIAQHMPHEFIAGMARWLNSATQLQVMIAQDGMTLRSGQVVIAPGTAHIALQRHGMHLTVELLPEMGNYRYQPSVDVLFESVARTCGSAAVGVVLTGMGEDGANGLLAMRQQGAYTLAQDEATSTVFGMPRAAIDKGAVEQVEPLTNLAPEILKVI